MSNQELVIASNLKKNPNCFEFSLFGMENGIFTESPGIGPNLIPIPWYLHKILLSSYS